MSKKQAGELQKPLPTPKTKKSPKPRESLKAKAKSGYPKTPVPAVRVLDIEEQFKLHAKGLVSAATAGAHAHKTANIAESGGPLENAVRALFQKALSTDLETCAGYFFDNERILSNQCDLLICGKAEVLRFPPADGLVQKYVPFNCVRVIGQVKNSFSKLKEALEQSSKAVEAWRRMSTDETIVWEDDVTTEPLAIIIIGKGGTEERAQEILGGSPRPRAAYVLLAEPGILFAPQDSIAHFESRKGLFYTGQGNDAPLVRVEINQIGGDERGRLLMRLFFAVLSRAAPTTKSFIALHNRIEQDFPLKYGSSPAML